MTSEHFNKVQELKDKGWLLRFEVNLILGKINCIIYNERQKRDGIVEKVSVWNTIEEGINWLHAWKFKNNKAMDDIINNNK